MCTPPALGRSKDIRPSPLVCAARESSHGLPKVEGICVALGAGREGSAGLSRVCPAAGLDFIIFSKWLRREDTGFYWYISNMKSKEHSGAYNGRAIMGILFLAALHGNSLTTAFLGGVL
jgi:hypothetical protein